MCQVEGRSRINKRIYLTSSPRIHHVGSSSKAWMRMFFSHSPWKLFDGLKEKLTGSEVGWWKCSICFAHRSGSSNPTSDSAGPSASSCSNGLNCKKLKSTKTNLNGRMHKGLTQEKCWQAKYLITHKIKTCVQLQNLPQPPASHRLGPPRSPPHKQVTK